MSISGVLNTSEGTMSAWGREISWIHWGISSCMWGIPWVHWGMFSTSRDIMSTLGDIMSTLGVSIEIERIYQVAPPNASWYPSDVLNIPQCTHDIPPPPPPCTNGIQSPMYTWYPPMYWTCLNVLMISPHLLNIPWCTEYPPIYWTHIIQGEHGWIVWHIWNTTVIFLLLPW